MPCSIVFRPSCAANQPVVLTHFLGSSVMLRIPATLINFPWIPFIPPRPLSHHCRVTCSTVLQAGWLHLNISLWHDNTLNMPHDMIYTGHRRHLHVPVPWCNRRGLWSVTWRMDLTLCDKLGKGDTLGMLALFADGCSHRRKSNFMGTCSMCLEDVGTCLEIIFLPIFKLISGIGEIIQPLRSSTL